SAATPSGVSKPTRSSASRSWRPASQRPGACIDMRPVLIFGASRGVGLLLARLLRQKDIPVFAMLRSEAARADLEAAGALVSHGDAFSVCDVEHACALLQAEFDVVSTLGGLGADGRYVDDEGNINVINSAAA